MECHLQIIDRLLEWHQRNLSEPFCILLLLPCRDLLDEIESGEPLFVLRPSLGFQRERPVINEPTTTNRLPEQDFLSGSRVETVFEGLMHA